MGAETETEQEKVHLLAVFDGHRGSEASKFAAIALPYMFAHEINRAGDSLVSAALSRTFLQLDYAISGLYPPGGSKHPGSAGIVAAVAGDTLTLANAGDCGAVLGVRKAATLGNAELGTAFEAVSL